MNGPQRVWPHRIAIGALWTVTVLEAAGMGLAGWSKFANPAGWSGMFVNWGYPAWFAFVIGASEMAGAALLLIPALATYAAAGLAVIMVGALGTVIAHDSPLGVAAPIANLVAVTIVGVARRRRRWKPGGKQAPD